MMHDYWARLRFPLLWPFGRLSMVAYNGNMPEGLTTDEFAAELGTTPMAVRKMLDRGLIKGTKHGSMWFIPRSELEKVRTRKRGRPKITKE